MAVAIVGVIAALILPATISKFNERILDLGYVRETKAIETAVDNLLVGENKDFFSTMMYLNDEPESYESSSGAFLKKYLKVSKYCGDSNGTCFADKYYTYENNDKKEYIPSYKGACASLKNGMSICLQPQIGANSIVGLLDINGPKGPNVWQKDLRLIILSLRSRVGRIETTEEVLTAGDLISLGNGEVVPPENPPETSNRSLC